MLWVKNSVEEIVGRALEEVGANDKIGFSFHSREFRQGAGGLHFRRAEDVTFSDVWEMISMVIFKYLTTLFI